MYNTLLDTFSPAVNTSGLRGQVVVHCADEGKLASLQDLLREHARSHHLDNLKDMYLVREENDQVPIFTGRVTGHGERSRS